VPVPPLPMRENREAGLRLLDIIDTYAAANGLKRSEAIRPVIDEGIIARFPHIKIAEVLSGAKIVHRRKPQRKRP
jgi:hypothetical protein